MDRSTTPSNSVERGRGKPLSDCERRRVLEALLAQSRGGKLKHGAIGSVSKQFGLSRTTVSQLWQRGLKNINNGAGFMDVSSRKKLCGRKKKDYSTQIASLSSVPLRQRQNLRSAAASINVPTTVLFQRKQEGVLRVHNSAVKPLLTERNLRKLPCRSNGLNGLE